jgi:hypothetical protein
LQSKPFLLTLVVAFIHIYFSFSLQKLCSLHLGCNLALSGCLGIAEEKHKVVGELKTLPAG